MNFDICCPLQSICKRVVLVQWEVPDVVIHTVARKVEVTTLAILSADTLGMGGLSTQNPSHVIVNST